MWGTFNFYIEFVALFPGLCTDFVAYSTKRLSLFFRGEPGNEAMEFVYVY